jgi:hypothetical protein
MKKPIRFLIMMLLVLTLCSCATGMPFTQLNPSIMPENQNTGRVFFYRPSALGAALKPDIIMNGESVGKAISQGFFFKDCQPGKYEIITSTEVKRKVSFVLDKGQTRFIRFKVSPGFFVGHVYGELIDPQEAMPEIQKCKLAEPEKPSA